MTSGGKKILVIDDDEQVLRKVASHLEKTGYSVVTAKGAREGLNLAFSTSPDLIVLDMTFVSSETDGTEDLDGINVLLRLREADSTPVIMLSSTNASAVKAMVLDLGADDYVSKPFDASELGARIAAILRRAQASQVTGPVLEFRRLLLDPGGRCVRKDGEPVELTATEFGILYSMARRPGLVFTREMLLDAVWKDNRFCVPKVVDVHILSIRRKIEDNPAEPTLIATVRGVGYRFADESPVA